MKSFHLLNLIGLATLLTACDVVEVKINNDVLSGQDYGELEKRDHPVTKAVNGVDISGPFTVSVNQGEPAAELEVPEQLHEKISVTIEGNLLKVKTTESFSSSGPLKLNVTLASPVQTVKAADRKSVV